MPDISLPVTSGDPVKLDALPGYQVFYVYPMTGRPDVPLPDGWNEIPAARGWTPQSCAFRDHHAELRALKSSVYGISTQASDYQREARQRLYLPFELLSDVSLLLKRKPGLPVFSVDGLTLYKRLTLIVRDGVIVKPSIRCFRRAGMRKRSLIGCSKINADL